MVVAVWSSRGRRSVGRRTRERRRLRRVPRVVVRWRAAAVGRTRPGVDAGRGKADPGVRTRVPTRGARTRVATVAPWVEPRRARWVNVRRPTGGATSAAAGAWTSGTDGAGEGTGAATGVTSGAAGAGVASVGGRAAIAAAASAARSDSTADLRSSAIDSVAVSFFSKRVCIASSLDPTFARAVMISPANLLRLLPAFVVTREWAGERLEMDSCFGSDAALHPKVSRAGGETRQALWVHRGIRRWVHQSRVRGVHRKGQWTHRRSR